MSSFCLPTEFDCGDHMSCIRKSWMCDGTKDCLSGRDESPENCINITCRADQFQCKDHTCIAGHLHCSGEPECKDGSDELYCGESNTKCDPTKQFDCGGGTCIPLSNVCDGRQDCPDWEDEPKDKCGKNECLDNNGGCSQKCVDILAGYYCECNQGYKLLDNKTCKGIRKSLCLHKIKLFKS